ncbi:uncharacterized protein LOC113272675 [Papaver somniferum]|uniref:uncharacterized protein LOC113272675 n=1 Tax=Papaver somniferum TaxID=3469 RepID=UPI000E6FC3FA|nr:uncharacterized protein LOC113272675 [Papaver somniferum]
MGWRLKENTDSLWVWKGIKSGIEQIQKNCFWNLGKGDKISIWSDYWIPGVKPPIPDPNNNTENINYVKDLINSNKTWDNNILRRCFNADTIIKIQQIPIPVDNRDDKFVWNLTSNGKFTVKSLYNNLNSYETDGRDWNKIWNLQVSPSIKMFVWKLANSILPNSMQVAAILPNINKTCQLCNEHNETMTHMFLECKFVTQVWNHLNFSISYVRGNVIDCHEWMNNWFINTEKDGTAMSWEDLCSTISWHIWKARCNKLLSKKDQNSWKTAKTIVKYINSYLSINSRDYDIIQSMYYDPLIDQNLHITKLTTWHYPCFMRYRINIALSMITDVCDSAIALTLVDDTGTFKEARGESSGWNSKELLELNGAESAFQWETELNGYNIEFQCDSEPTLMLLIGMYAKSRANRFKDSSFFGSQYNKPLNFKATSFILINRQNNALTANLAIYFNKSITLDR